MTVAESLKRFREKFKLSKSAAAEAAGIKAPAFGYYEDEKRYSVPNAQVIINLAEKFNVSTDYLLGLTDDPRTVNQILAEMQTSAPSAEKVLTLESLQAQLNKQAAEIEALKAKFLALERGKKFF